MVKSSLHHPEIKGDPEFKIKNDIGKLWKVYLYIDDDRIPFIESVTYHLHASYRKPIETIYKSMSNYHFAMIVWLNKNISYTAKIKFIDGKEIIEKGNFDNISLP